MSATPRTDAEMFVAVSRPDIDLEAVRVDFARELEHALRTIATLADLPADATPDTIVQRVRDLWARDIHSCHDQCTKPLCVATRERDALRAERDALRILHAQDKANYQCATKASFAVEEKLKAESLDLRQENAALRAERDAAVTAIRGCVDWANGRECEWGDRAENAFGFLYRFLANLDAAREAKP